MILSSMPEQKESTPVTFDQLVAYDTGKPSVLIISAACCAPLAQMADNKLKHNIKTVLDEFGFKSQINTVSIMESESIIPTVSKEHQALVGELIDMFEAQGFDCFPALIINGKLISHGGVPTVDMIREKITGLTS